MSSPLRTPGHWLKIVDATRAALPDDWLSSAAGRELLERVRFPPNRRPTGVAHGDRLVYYASNRRRYFAVVEVVSSAPYEDAGAGTRWPWVLDVRPRLLLARLDTAPPLDDLCLRHGTLSVRRGSHVRLELDQYQAALEGLARVAG